MLFRTPDLWPRTSSMRRVCLRRVSLLRATATQPPKPLPWRLPSPGASFVSTVSAGHPTSAVSTRNADPTAVSTNTLEDERQLEVLWEDHTSHYDWTWLRVNCPSFVHERGHRTVFPGDVDPELKPVEVREQVRVHVFFLKVCGTDGTEPDTTDCWKCCCVYMMNLSHETSKKRIRPVV